MFCCRLFPGFCIADARAQNQKKTGGGRNGYFVASLKGGCGFESRPGRHRVFRINNLSFTFQPGSHFRPNFWISARKGCRREFSACLSFPITPRDSLNSNQADPFRSMSHFPISFPYALFRISPRKDRRGARQEAENRPPVSRPVGSGHLECSAARRVCLKRRCRIPPGAEDVYEEGSFLHHPPSGGRTRRSDRSIPSLPLGSIWLFCPHTR